MFIIQRLFGVSIFVLSLLVICYLIHKSNDYRRIKYIFIIYILFLSFISYCFKPVTAVDLTRLQEQLVSTFSTMSFNDLLLKLKSGSITNYTTFFYFFVVAKIGNLNLLQTFASFIFYSIIFYIVYDYSKNNKISSSVVSKVIFYIMINGQFVELISGIRTLLGFSILLIAFYREFYKDKSILSNIILYVIAVGFHNAILPIFLIRLIYLGIQKEKNIVVRLFNLFLLFALAYIIYKYGFIIIESSINRANLYLNKSIYIQKWEYLASFFRVALMYFILFVSHKIKSKSSKTDKYLNLGIYYLIFTTIFYGEYTFFHRYSIFISLFMIPIVIDFINKTDVKSANKDGRIVTLYKLIYIVLLLIIVGLVFTRGNMTELTFF